MKPTNGDICKIMYTIPCFKIVYVVRKLLIPRRPGYILIPVLVAQDPK